MDKTSSDIPNSMSMDNISSMICYILKRERCLSINCLLEN